ncbi:hypothetical protein JT30_6008 [Burkholderia pseudomallei]|nr:hypothetical protein JT30_6008 [Burkholderia pseudomallei]
MKLTDSMMPLVAYARQLAQSPRGDAAEVALRLDILIERARATTRRARAHPRPTSTTRCSRCARGSTRRC